MAVTGQACQHGRVWRLPCGCAACDSVVKSPNSQIHMVLVSRHTIGLNIPDDGSGNEKMHVNSLESVFRPIPRKVARIADVIGEIIGFPPMRKPGSRILAVER